MTDFYTFFIFVFSSYLLGSISFAIVVSKFRGLKDPRIFGSGNPGATNVFRSGDRIAGLLTFTGDALKGWIVVVGSELILRLYFETTLNSTGNTLVALCSIFVLLGHIYPVFHNFKGGKGVATAFGIFYGGFLELGLSATLIWVFAFLVTKISGLSAILTSLAVLMISIYLMFANEQEYFILNLTHALIAAILLLRHSSNVAALFENHMKR